MLKRVYKICSIIIAVTIIAIAILMSLARGITPYIAEKQNTFEKQFSDIIQQPVKIGNIEAAWRGFEPVIRFQHVIILQSQNDEPALQINTVDIGINIFRSILTMHIQPGIIAISGVHLTIQQQSDNSLVFVGLPFIPAIHLDSQENASSGILAKILKIKHVYIDDIDLELHLNNNKNMTIHRFNGDLSNGVIHHYLRGNFILQQNIPAEMNFILDMQGDLQNIKDLNTNIYLSAKNFNLKNELIPNNIKNIGIKKGLADFQVWITWQKNQITALQTKVKLSQLQLINVLKQTEIPLESLSGKFSISRNNTQGFQFSGNDVLITSQHHQWPVIKFVGSTTSNDQANIDDKLFVSDIPLKLISNFIINSKLFPENIVDKLAAIQPEGDLKNLSISKNNLGISLATDLQHVSMRAYKNIPGFDGLNGHVVMTPNAGKAELFAKNITIDAQQYFPQVFSLREFQLDFIWQKINSNWIIQVAPFYVSNDDLGLRASGNIILRPQQSPDVNLLLGLSNFNMTSVSHYLPVKVMHKKLISWLSNAFHSGKAIYSTVVLHGKLSDFPFDDHQGTFSVQTHFENVDLLFNQDWPMIYNLTGQMAIDGRKLTVQTNTGNMINSPVDHATAIIPNLYSNPDIIVNGAVHGDLKDALNFLKTSPLKNTIGKHLADMELKGPMNLQLYLDIPLKDAKNNIETHGIVTTKQAQLDLRSWKLQLNNIQGKLQFTQDELTAHDISATLWQKPIMLNVVTLSKPTLSRITQIDVQGNINTDLIKQQFKIDLNPYIQGATNYHAILQLRNKENVANSLELTSNLKGISANLPKPFTKNANATLPSTTLIYFNDKQPIQMQVHLSNMLNAALILNKNSKGITLENGNIHLGSGNANFQKQSGLFIDGTLEHFDYSTWHQFVTENQTNSKNNFDIKKYLREIDLQVANFDIFNQSFSQMQLSMLPTKEYWQFMINAPNLNGEIHLPYNLHDHTIWARLKKFTIESKDDKSNASFKPQELPALDVAIDDFQSNQKDLGEINFKTRPSREGMNIEQLQMTTQISQLNASGKWLDENNHSHTFLHGSLASNNLSALLTSWQLTPIMSAKQVDAEFILDWFNTPFNIAFDKVNGTIKLKIKNGVFSDVGAQANVDINFARLLNILSIQSLPRRLLFNFNDLSGKGFPFDSFIGTFNLKNGNAVTKDTAVRGTIADVNMQGTIGLHDKNLELHLEIIPHVTSSLPVIATIAGGPIAGVATWVADKVFSPAVNKIIARYYQVSGSWQQPVIKEVYQQKM